MKSLERLFAACALALAIGGAGACEHDDPCDPGEILARGACVPAPKMVSDTGAPGASDAAAIDGGASDGGGAAASGFGQSCGTAADCPSGLDWCARQAPSDPTGFCTKRGCNTNPSFCPSAWTCMDLSVFSPGLPHICVNQ